MTTRLLVSSLLFALGLSAQSIPMVGPGMAHALTAPTSINPSCQSLGANGGTTSSINTTGANYIAVSVAWVGGQSIAVTENKGNGSPTGLTIYNASGSNQIQIFYWTNPTVGSGHTFTVTGSNTFSSICVSPWSGMQTSSVSDGTDNGSGSVAATCSTGSISPGGTNKLVITALVDSGIATDTINSSYVIDAQVPYSAGVSFGGAIAHIFQSTGTATNPQWTGNNTTACGIAAFKGQ